MLARIIHLSSEHLELVFFDADMSDIKLTFKNLATLNEFVAAVTDARNEFVDNLAGDNDESKERT